MRGVAGHEAQLSITDVIDLAGTPVTSLPRTWCDLAPSLTVAELVALGDAIVGGLRRVHDGSGAERFRRVAPAVDRLVLARAVAERPGCRGVRRLRMALELLDGRAESPKESELRMLIVGSGLPAPEPQVEVRNRLGDFIARVDLAYRHAQVAIEYEGDHHRSDRVQWQKDIVRTRALEAAGWTVVRCTQHDLTHPNALVDCLRRLA
jgi:very-short-patch-repair endonuclease